MIFPILGAFLVVAFHEFFYRPARIHLKRKGDIYSGKNIFLSAVGEALKASLQGEDSPELSKSTKDSLRNILDEPEHLNSTVDELFEEFDKDNSGTICREEAAAMLGAIAKKMKCGSLNLSGKQIDLVFEHIDKDKNGSIDKKEFKQFFVEIIEICLKPRVSLQGTSTTQKFIQELGEIEMKIVA